MDAAVKAWAQRALLELDEHLHVDGAEMHALAAAGAHAGTMYTLYPFDGADYVHGLRNLVRNHLLAHRQDVLNDLCVQAMGAFPYELGSFLPEAYRNLWTASEIENLCAANDVDLLANDYEETHSFYFLFRFVVALNALARPEPPGSLRNGRSGLDYVVKQVPEMMPVAAGLLGQAQRLLSAR